MKVFVLDTDRKPLDPVHPGQARRMLKQGRAAVFRMYPFTIILKYAVSDEPEPLRVKIDPGSRKSGIAVVNDATGEIVFAAEIGHRGSLIKKSLEQRRNARRSRLRYRKPRFLNRTRPEGWLPPSLLSRVLNIETWVKRLVKFAPVSAVSQELVRFDTQKTVSPEISGAEYQQGELSGYEIREHLLEKWGRKCAYCGKSDIPLEIEHIVPKSRGGSDRVSNLSLACVKCNQRKGSRPVEIFLKKKPELLKKILAQAKAPLKDAAAVNSTRWALYNRLKAFGLPVEAGSGGLTKYNRTKRNLPKSHWLDAACVGKSTPGHLKTEGIKPLHIRAGGQGGRQKAVL
ncbi:MAG: HNH endonuclease, partial [Herbaspirillum sp.]|nr:HNH endonuclease [Herbaspirillum sp.]